MFSCGGTGREQPTELPTTASTRGELRAGAAEGFNLLVITLDTVRADHVGIFGGPPGTTPALDALGERGLVFRQAVTPAPITLPAHASIFTGLNPPAHGVRINGFHRLAQDQYTLAEILRRAGYSTAAVVGSAVLDASMGLAQGFDHYDDVIGDRGGDDGTPLERSASVVTDLGVTQLGSWVDSEKPGLLWLHYFDAHDPYEPPSPFDARFADNPYLGEIAYVDQEVGRLTAALDRLGLAANTLVVVVGDHGEGLGQHGETTHTHLIYDSTMRVPMIIVPGDLLDHPVVLDEPVVSLCDVAPTVLSLLRVPAVDDDDAPLDLDGADLLTYIDSDLGRDREIYMETLWPQLMHGWAPIRGLRTSTDKYISAPVPEYYRLDEDPQELKNLLPDADERTRNRVGFLSEKLGRTTEESGMGIAPETMDPATVEQLLALGYVVDIEAAGRPPSSIKPEPLSIMIERWQQRWHELLESHEAQLANSREVLLRSVALAPDDPAAHLALGEFLMTHGEIAAAEECFSRTTELDPDGVEGWLRLADVRGATEDWAGVEAAVAQARDVAPDDYRVAMLEGRLAFFRGDAKTALERFRVARRTAPPDQQRNLDLWIRRAQQRL